MIKTFNYSFIHQNKDYVQSPFLLKYLKTQSIFFCAEPMRILYDKELFRKLRQKDIDKKLYYRMTNSFNQICKKILLKKSKSLIFKILKLVI